MSFGIVKKMDDGHYNTPNKGVLVDAETGIEYAFERPSDPTRRSYTWNVKVHDAVTFTISDNKATEVTLYKKHRDGVVFSYKP
jgi:hypothetical protein